jgi:hypothetical protein
LIKWRLFIILLVSGLSVTTVAQTVEDDVLLLELVAQQNNNLTSTDTVAQEDSVAYVQDTVWESYPHPLCLPLMYIPLPMKSLIDTTPDTYTIAAIRQNALQYITRNHADLYVSVSDPSRLSKIDMGRNKVHRIAKRKDSGALDINRMVKINDSPWRRQAYVSLQVTQSYATENWHQGSVNAFSMLGNAKAYANYKGKNLSWENSAEWRVGVSTISGDTVHKMNTTDDRLTIYSKFGYQVHPKWYVSTFADFKTNLFPNFQKNSNKLNTTFLTPIRYTMGVGVDCKPVKGLNINFSPATYKLVYANINDINRIDVSEFGLAQDQKLLQEVGSSLRVEWEWKPLREIKVETKFYFFTNYKQIETDLEIDVDFIINRYMSAKLLIHPRYDGTIENVTDEPSKIQFKELISVGFAHTFR